MSEDSKPHSRLDSEKALLLGLNALRLEVPSPVWADIYERSTAYVKEANSLFEQLQAAQQEASDMRKAAGGMSADLTHFAQENAHLEEQYAAATESSEAMGRALAAAHTKITGLEEQLEAAQAENRMLRMWLCTDGAIARGLAESMIELPLVFSVEGVEENCARIVELLNIEQRLGLPSASNPASEPKP